MLLEREHELATLDSFVSGVGRAGPRLGLIEGPAGIGKTTLLAEARRLAESDGIRILSARGSELERGFSYGVLRQLFEPLLTDPAARKRAFAAAAAAALPVFEAPGTAEHSEEAGFATLHALYWLTLNLAGEEPLVLVIDDLHWADQPSLRFVAYLVRRLEELPVLVVAAVRPSEPGADHALIAEIARDPLTVGLHLGPLSPAAVTELIADRLGEDPAEAFSAACHTATGGNPLLVYELLRALAAERVAPQADQTGVVADLGPRAASRAVLLRLARLPREAATVARAIAVLGEGAELWAVAELAELDEQTAADATGALARAEIVRPEPPLGFVHPLVRAAVYLELSPGERELQHARAAELLRAAQAPAEQVAAHILVAPGVEGPWVLDTLRRAATASLRRGAAENAVPCLRRALEEPLAEAERARLLHDLGRAELNTTAPGVLEHLTAAYELLADPRERAEVALLIAWMMIFTRDHEGAKVVAAEAAADAGEEVPDVRLGLEALELFTIYFGAGSQDELRRLEPYRATTKVGSAGEAMIVGAAAYDWANRIGPKDECVALARRALGEKRLFEYDQGMIWCGATLVLVYAEEPDALETWARPYTQVYRGGALFAAHTMNVWGGYTAMLLGDLEEAWKRFEAGLETGILWGGGERIDNVPACFIAQTLVERGDVTGGRAALDATTSEVVHGSFAGNLWRRAEVEVLAAEGRLEEAAQAARVLGERLGPMDNPAAHPWRTVLGEVLLRLDRHDEAAELAKAELKLAKAWGAPGPIGRALRVLGLADRKGGLGHLTEAVTELEGSQARLELAKALAAVGTATRLARRPTEAREPLYRALEVANVCGATALEERVRTELGATGARPRREALSGAGALTPSERRVADLAAVGRSNREIAQELFVTPKTVEVHLSNTYRKLGIRGRRDLPATLAAAAA